MPTGEGLQCEVSGMSRALSKALPVHKWVLSSPPTRPCLLAPDRLEYSRSVSGMELVIEELVEVMVLKEGLMP